MSFPASSARHRGRGGSFDVTPIVSTGDCHDASTNGCCCRGEGKVEMPTLETLCLRSLESSLGKGLATFDLQDLPLGLAEKIYEFVSSKGSRMANMEILRALAPLLRQHVNSLDFSKTKVSLPACSIWEALFDRYRMDYFHFTVQQQYHTKYIIHGTNAAKQQSSSRREKEYISENLGGCMFEVQATNNQGCTLRVTRDYP